MRDPDLRGATITVTSVDVSPDLRNAVAYVMPLGGKDVERFLAALRRAAPWFRARVSEKAGLRSAPEIRFKLSAESQPRKSVPQLAGMRGIRQVCRGNSIGAAHHLHRTARGAVTQ
jgi:ribosome-binding factor A